MNKKRSSKDKKEEDDTEVTMKKSKLIEMDESLETSSEASESEEESSSEEVKEILLEEVPVIGGTFTYEDIVKDDDVELWLIKTPSNFDTSLIDGEKLDLLDGCSLESKKEGTLFSIEEGSLSEADSIVNIWPSDKKKRLVLGKPFEKFVQVSQVLNHTEKKGKRSKK